MEPVFPSTSLMKLTKTPSFWDLSQNGGLLLMYSEKAMKKENCSSCQFGHVAWLAVTLYEVQFTLKKEYVNSHINILFST